MGGQGIEIRRRHEIETNKIPKRKGRVEAEKNDTEEENKRKKKKSKRPKKC